MKKGAILDSTGLYRYTLWREWDGCAPKLVFVMLNPSRADAIVDDPTIRRCLGFARTWGYGSLEVVNLFAYRTSHPSNLAQVADPVGPENDRYLEAAMERCDRAGIRVVIAWGNGGLLLGRNEEVLRAIAREDLYCLGVTKRGQPRHPLYLKSDTVPTPLYTDGVV